MNNFNQLMKQAQEMQAKLMEAQGKINELEIEGSSGGGMVNVTISGKIDLKKVVIDPALLTTDNADIVSDLIVAAFNDAKTKLETKVSENMGGILPPGMKLPF